VAFALKILLQIDSRGTHCFTLPSWVPVVFLYHFFHGIYPHALVAFRVGELILFAAASCSPRGASLKWGGVEHGKISVYDDLFCRSDQHDSHTPLTFNSSSRFGSHRILILGIHDVTFQILDGELTYWAMCLLPVLKWHRLACCSIGAPLVGSVHVVCSICQAFCFTTAAKPSNKSMWSFRQRRARLKWLLRCWLTCALPFFGRATWVQLEAETPCGFFLCFAWVRSGLVIGGEGRATVLFACTRGELRLTLMGALDHSCY
jgi:hypothetical protein